MSEHGDRGRRWRPAHIDFSLFSRSVAVLALLLAVAYTPIAAAESAGYKPIKPDLDGIVVDEDWARIMGKLLFWEQQIGSDGIACASCHFSAGADSRITNQLNPGFNIVKVDPVTGEQVPDEDHSFGDASGLLASGRPAAPNITMTPEDFPFQRHADESDRDSAITFDMNDVMSSSGSFDSLFIASNPTHFDKCKKISDIFHTSKGRPSRAVEPRNTPTTINSAFNHRQFWDMRAKNKFNGKGVFGWTEIENDPTARVMEVDTTSGEVAAKILSVDNASLASQAVGPPLSNLEMSCGGRTWGDIGREMLHPSVYPLFHQYIDNKHFY